MHPSAETMVELMVEFAAWLTRRRERTNRNACVRVCVCLARSLNQRVDSGPRLVGNRFSSNRQPVVD